MNVNRFPVMSKRYTVVFRYSEFIFKILLIMKLKSEGWYERV